MRRISIEELLNVEGAKVNVTRKKQPNITLMAKAFINLRKETVK